MDHPEPDVPFWTQSKVAVVAFLICAIVVSGFPLKSWFEERSLRAAALAKAKEIHFALTEFAFENDGIFPTAENDSNSAYRQLFDDDFQDESLFRVPGSAYHRSLPVTPSSQTDGQIIGLPDFILEMALQRGSNHWAYVGGLNSDSPGYLPVIADGFTSVPGTYSDDPTEKGGIWRGKAAIIIRVDGSGKLEQPTGPEFRVFQKSSSGTDIDIFSKDFIGDSAEILNPL